MTPAEVHSLAMRHGLSDEAAVVATAICWAEIAWGEDDPHLDPSKVGDVNLQDDVWGPSVGLYQVRSLRADTGTGKERDVERLGDPSFNTRSMVAISNAGQNWRPWSVYRNGRYLAYVDKVTAAIQDEGEQMEGWMPDVIHTPPNSRSGLTWLDGTAWKLLLHTTESNYRRSQGGRVNYHGHQSYPHFEVSEEAIEQYLPITVGAYALAGATSEWGAGNAAHAVQVEIVWAAGNAANMSEKLLRNIARVLTFLRGQTGMAPNLPPQGFPTRVSKANWFSVVGWYNFEGLCGHGNVPGNFDRWDPGPLPAERIVAYSNEEMGEIPTQEDDMALPIFGDSPDGRDYGFWMIDGAFKKRLHSSDVWGEANRIAEEHGIPSPKHIGKIPLALFDALIDIDELARR